MGFENAPSPAAATVDTTASLGGALADATRRLAAAGVPEPRRDAAVLLAAALEADIGVVLADPQRPLPREARDRFAAMLAERAARRPVSRILSTREFWSLPLALGAATLDPRPDSETLVEAVLARQADRRAPLRVLDLGTGSGCLLLALLSELPNAWGLGVDIAPAALAVARNNAERLGLAARCAWLAGDWGAALRGGFDIVVCNPPYVLSDDIGKLAPEVARYDPWPALDGGATGLAAYQALAPQLSGLLAPGGLAAIELGEGQGAAVQGLLRQAGLDNVGLVPDLSGVLRCLVATRVPPGEK